MTGPAAAALGQANGASLAAAVVPDGVPAALVGLLPARRESERFASSQHLSGWS
jgi:hypothetical protein